MKPISAVLGTAIAISLFIIAGPSDVNDTSDVAGMQQSTSALLGADRLASAQHQVSSTDRADAPISVVADQDSFATLGVAIAALQPTTFVGPPQPVADDATKEPADRDASPEDKMSGPVAALAASGVGVAEIVVRYNQHPELFDDERVAELGGTVTRSYEHFDMRAISIPAAALPELANGTNVDWLSLDDQVSTLSFSSRLAVNLPSSASQNAGYQGSNVGIAVIDTGVSKHSDLGDNILQYSFLDGAYPEPVISNGEIVSFEDDKREDKFGHGTHVAGVLGGNGADSNDEFKGSATGAKILALQVLDQNGNGSMSDVMAALDWLHTYGSYFNVRVVNLSLGKVISESNQTDPLVAAVEALWDAGMVVVVAAGNDGYNGSMTVNSPGNSRKVITVGSLTDNGTGSDYDDDYVSSFSSIGPTVGDYVLKPDLVAPGNRIIASIPKNSKLAEALRSRIRACMKSGCDEEYLELSGTSMAAPMASAAVALMLEKDPTLTPATVKARLMRSARKLDTDPAESGAGLIDVEAALEDAGVVTGEALSPTMLFDSQSGNVLVEDTAMLWGDSVWGSGYLYFNGFSWAAGAAYTDEEGVTATGYMWTDSRVSAKGYMWTDGGVSAKGYMWTDSGGEKGGGRGVKSKSLLSEDGSELFLNDDAPVIE